MTGYGIQVSEKKRSRTERQKGKAAPAPERCYPDDHRTDDSIVLRGCIRTDAGAGHAYTGIK